MFHFSTGIKSLATFDPDIGLEDKRTKKSHPSAKTEEPIQPTQFPAKQAYLYKQAILAATKLRGSYLYFLKCMHNCSPVYMVHITPRHLAIFFLVRITTAGVTSRVPHVKKQIRSLKRIQHQK